MGYVLVYGGGLAVATVLSLLGFSGGIALVAGIGFGVAMACLLPSPPKEPTPMRSFTDENW